MKQQYEERDLGHDTPCWWWLMHKTAEGYGLVKIDGVKRQAHKAYYERERGPVPEGLELDHLCAIPSCVNPQHLEAVTRLENVRRSRRAKLTVELVAEIKSLLSTTGDNELGRRYGVNSGTINNIRSGRTWKDVEALPEPPTATPDTEKCDDPYCTDAATCGKANPSPPTPDECMCGHLRSQHDWGECRGIDRFEITQRCGCNYFNPSPPIQPDQAKKTDQNFSSPENSKETLPVPIQGEGPYRVVHEPGVGFDVIGPDGLPFTNNSNRFAAESWARGLNMAYQAGASSKDQVVEAAKASDTARYVKMIAAGLGGAASTDDADVAKGYAAAARDDLLNLAERLATTTPSPNEAEIRADERRRIDELAASLEGFRAELFYDDGGWVLDQYMNQEFRAKSFTEALAATQSIQAEAGDKEGTE